MSNVETASSVGFQAALEELEAAHGVDLSAPRPPEVGTLEEARALVATLWSVARSLVASGDVQERDGHDRDSLRKLLGSEDKKLFEQGFELLATLDERELWETFAEGVRFTEVESAGRTVHKMVVGTGPLPSKEEGHALVVARHAGLLDGIKDLDLSGDQYDLNRTLSFVHLSGLGALRTISLQHCRALSEVRLSELASLESLDLSFCVALKSLNLSGLKSLKKLELRRGSVFEDERPCPLPWPGTHERYALSSLRLSDLPSLKFLKLHSCSWLTDLSGLSELPALTRMSLWETGTASTDLGPIGKLTTLKKLEICDCLITDLGPLSNLRSLTSLDLSGSYAVTDLRPLSGLSSLTSLDLSGCHGVTDFSPLSGLNSLTTLNLSGTLSAAGALSKDQKRQLAQARKQLSSSKWSSVEEGIASLKALADPLLWAILGDGIHIAKGKLIVDEGEVKKRVKSAHREQVALHVARQTGLLGYVAELDLSSSSTLKDLSPIEDLPNLKVIR